MYKPSKHRILLISQTEIFTDDWSFEKNIKQLISLAKSNLNRRPNWSVLHKSPVERCYIKIKKLIYIKIK